MTQDNQKTFRIGQRTHKQTGTLTIVSVVDPVGSGGSVKYGVSFASPKDVYNKQLGVELATERLNAIDDSIYAKFSEAYAGSAFTPVRKHNEVVLCILCDIIARNALPDWARALVREHMFYVLLKGARG